MRTSLVKLLSVPLFFLWIGIDADAELLFAFETVVQDGNNSVKRLKIGDAIHNVPNIYDIEFDADTADAYVLSRSTTDSTVSLLSRYTAASNYTQRLQAGAAFLFESSVTDNFAVHNGIVAFETVVQDGNNSVKRLKIGDAIHNVPNIYDIEFDADTADAYVLSRSTTDSTVSLLSRYTAASNYTQRLQAGAAFLFESSATDNFAVHNGIVAFETVVQDGNNSVKRLKIGDAIHNVPNIYDIEFDADTADAYVLSRSTTDSTVSLLSRYTAASNYTQRLQAGAAFLFESSATDNFGVYSSSASLLPGDYNNDGTVDLADYTIWRNNLGDSITLPGDTTPGNVTAADYDIWKQNFGQSIAPNTGSSSQNVPEPAGVGLLVVAMLVMLVVARKA